MNLDDLNQFTGSENYYRHWSRRFVYTDGIRYLAEEAKAYWLLDAIASFQPQLVKNPRLAEFQLWTLEVRDHHGLLVCREDSSVKPAVVFDIEYTDFPLPTIRLYVEGNVLLLATEH